MYKVEVNRTLSNDLFLTARYAHITGGFSLTPRRRRRTARYHVA